MGVCPSKEAAPPDPAAEEGESVENTADGNIVDATATATGDGEAEEVKSNGSDGEAVIDSQPTSEDAVAEEGSDAKSEDVPDGDQVSQTSETAEGSTSGSDIKSANAEEIDEGSANDDNASSNTTAEGPEEVAAGASGDTSEKDKEKESEEEDETINNTALLNPRDLLRAQLEKHLSRNIIPKIVEVTDETDSPEEAEERVRKSKQMQAAFLAVSCMSAVRKSKGIEEEAEGGPLTHGPGAQPPPVVQMRSKRAASVSADKSQAFVQQQRISMFLAMEAREKLVTPGEKAAPAAPETSIQKLQKNFVRQESVAVKSDSDELLLNLSEEDATSNVSQVWKTITRLTSDRYSEPRVVAPSEDRTGWQVVRVFVSSTLSDMAAEREVLASKVFPQLNEWCEERKLRLVPCDLRYGTTKHSNTGLVLRTYLTELDRCQKANQLPFFISLLGDRYGFAPSWGQLPRSVYTDFDWVPKTSVNHMELLTAAYWPKSPNAVVMIRDTDSLLNELPENMKQAFQEEHTYFKLAAEELKTRVRERLPESQVVDYKCKFNGTNTLTGKPKIGGLEHFEETVLDFLKKAIDNQYPVSTKTLSPLETMRSIHEGIAPTVLGRENEVETVSKYVTMETPRKGVSPFFIIGGEGDGKTACMSLIADEMAAAGRKVIFHSADSGPDCSDLVQLLQHICLELGEPDDVLEYSYNKLKQTVNLLLSQAMTVDGESLVLIIDGIDKFPVLDEQKAFSWLPLNFRANVRCVLSCTSREVVKFLQERSMDSDKHEIELQPIEMVHRESFVRERLIAAGKSLAPEWISKLMKNPASGNPLWLYIVTLIFEDFDKHDNAGQTIDQLPDSLEKLYEKIIAEIIGHEENLTTKQVLLYLAVANQGILERELLEALGVNDVGTKRNAMTMAKWTPIFNLLRPVIGHGRPGTESAGRIFLLNSSIRKMVLKDISPSDLAQVHSRLAKYFEKTTDERRKAQEYPFHLLLAEERASLRRYVRTKAFHDHVNYHYRRHFIREMRCDNTCQGDMHKGDVMCAECSILYTFAEERPNWQSCCCCADELKTQVDINSRDKPDFVGGEKQSVRCRKHNPKGFEQTIQECAVCKCQTSELHAVPVLQCEDCAAVEGCAAIKR